MRRLPAVSCTQIDGLELVGRPPLPACKRRRSEHGDIPRRRNDGRFHRVEARSKGFGQCMEVAEIRPASGPPTRPRQRDVRDAARVLAGHGDGVFVGGPIDFVAACVQDCEHASYSELAPGPRRHRAQRGDGNRRKIQAVCNPLRHARRDAQACERAWTDAHRNPFEIRSPDSRCSRHTIHHAENLGIVSARHDAVLLVDLAVPPDRRRARRSCRFECEHTVHSVIIETGHSEEIVMDAPTFLDLADAQRRLIDEVDGPSETETVALDRALDRVLASEIRASIDIPHFDNSAMDGYAVRHDDPAFAMESPELDVIGESFAGHPFAGALAPGTCVRIYTGARIPDGATAVVMQEDATALRSHRVRLNDSPSERQYVRARGSDVREGAPLLARGMQLGAAHLGLAASAGLTSLPCYRTPRVGYLTTGDEIRLPGSTLGPGDIYDSNHHFLSGALRRLPIEPVDLGHARDDVASLRETLARGMVETDAIISSGGVSVGAADLVGDVLEQMGTVAFWKVAMKPGKPLLFGHLGHVPFFGLPGNPVSTVVTFLQLARLALQKMCGLAPALPWSITATLRTRIDKSPGRLDFQRGIMESADDGSVEVRSTGDQSSAILSSVTRANCLIVLPREQGDLSEGTEVRIQPLSQFGL